MKSLYKELGGREVIENVVEIMYRQILDDQYLVAFFADVDVAPLQRKLRRFLHVATGGPDRISGLELRAAHARVVEMGLSENHIKAWLGHFRTALEEVEVAAEILDQVLARVGEAADDVLGR